MNKQITATHERDEVTTLERRKRLTGISISTETSHVALTYTVETLAPTGVVLKLQGETQSISFHKQVLNTAEGQIGGELPEDVSAFLQEVLTAVEPVFVNHASIKEDEE